MKKGGGSISVSKNYGKEGQKEKWKAAEKKGKKANSSFLMEGRYVAGV